MSSNFERVPLGANPCSEVTYAEDDQKTDSRERVSGKAGTTFRAPSTRDPLNSNASKNRGEPNHPMRPYSSCTPFALFRYSPAAKHSRRGFLMTLPVALSLVDVTVRYGPRVAVDGVSLEGAAGRDRRPAGAERVRQEHHARGRAGSRPRFRCGDGRGPGRAATRRVTARVGLVPQEPAVYDELTAYDNLMFFGELYGLGGSDLRRRAVRALALRLTDRARPASRPSPAA